MMPTWQMHWISAGLFVLDWDSHKNNEIEKFQAIPGISQFAWKFIEITWNFLVTPLIFSIDFFAFSGPKISFRFVLQLWNFELGHYVVFAKIYVFWLKFVLTHWIDAVHWSSLMLLEIWFHRFQSGNYLLHLYFTSALYSNCPSVIQLTFIVAET